MKTVLGAIIIFGLLRAPLALDAQVAPPADTTPVRALPPATKLEAFSPAAGSVVTVGYSELGRVGLVSADVRELKSSTGESARGLVVDVYESQYRRERAFVDEDEIDELLRGIDALLEVRDNPTQFIQFEVRYTTRGELQIVAYNTARGDIRFAVKAGRTLTATQQMTSAELTRLRVMIGAAHDKLGTLPR